jgi:hypothetical protein
MGISGFDFGFFTDATTTFSRSGNNFSLSLNGFLANTDYKYRVWARNNTGWSDINQANVVSFTTSSGLSAPTVQTLTANSITANSGPPECNRQCEWIGYIILFPIRHYCGLRQQHRFRQYLSLAQHQL